MMVEYLCGNRVTKPDGYRLGDCPDCGAGVNEVFY